MKQPSTRPPFFRFRRSLLHNDSGQIFVMLGLMAVFLLALTGYSIDVANSSYKKAQLRRALDAGAIAGISSLTKNLTSKSSEDAMDQAAADAVAIANYNLAQISAVAPDVEAGWDTITTPGVLKLNLLGSIQVNNLFMGLVGISSQRITTIAKAQRNPAIISLVLDISGSMACMEKTYDANGHEMTDSNGRPIMHATCEDRFEKLKLAAGNFVKKFQPKIDRIAIISFSDHATLQRPMSTFAKTEDLTNIIGHLSAYGATNIAEAMALGAKQVEGVTGITTAVRSIVLFTDGAPNTMQTNFLHPKGTLPQNISSPPTTAYSGNDVYNIWTSWKYESARGGYWIGTQRIFLPSGYGTDPKLPCGYNGDSSTFGTTNPSYASKDAPGCLNNYQFQDSKGIAHGNGDNLDPWYDDTEKEDYNLAIYEADYARNGEDRRPGTADDITVYVIGLGNAAYEPPKPIPTCQDGSAAPNGDTDKCKKWCWQGGWVEPGTFCPKRCPDGSAAPNDDTTKCRQWCWQGGWVEPGTFCPKQCRDGSAAPNNDTTKCKEWCWQGRWVDPDTCPYQCWDGSAAPDAASCPPYNPKPT